MPHAPTRVIDTRTGVGTIAAPLSGERFVGLTVVPPPPHTTAVVLNVTADRPTNESFLTLTPTKPTAAAGTSNLNYPAGRTIANLVTVPLADPDLPGVWLYNNTGTVDVIADLAGFYVDDEATPTGDGFTATSPKRVLDTRPGTTTGGPRPPRARRDPHRHRRRRRRHPHRHHRRGRQPHRHRHHRPVPPHRRTHRHRAADGVQPQLARRRHHRQPGHRRGRTRRRHPAPQQHRHHPGHRRRRRLVQHHRRRRLPTRHPHPHPRHPPHLADRRTPGPLGPGGTRTIDAPAVPDGATAVVANLTGVQPTATTHLTAWPTGTTLPTASNLNLPAGAIRPVAATIAVDPQARFDLRNNSGWVHTLADLQGYYG
ncbi:MAG: hypothetical protein R2726_07385 [Acidimicrobiales bacterium]